MPSAVLTIPAALSAPAENSAPDVTTGLHPTELPAACARGALLVDIRATERRVRDGALPGALVIPGELLERRLVPNSPDRLALAADPDREWILLSTSGQSAGLAAAALRHSGLRRVAGLHGGYQALKAAGMLSVATVAPHFLREVRSLPVG